MVWRLLLFFRERSGKSSINHMYIRCAYPSHPSYGSHPRYLNFNRALVHGLTTTVKSGKLKARLPDHSVHGFQELSFSIKITLNPSVTRYPSPNLALIHLRGFKFWTLMIFSSVLLNALIFYFFIFYALS